MGLSRREMVLAALSAGVGSVVLGGCSSVPRHTIARRPAANAGYPAGPTSRKRYTEVQPAGHPTGHIASPDPRVTSTHNAIAIAPAVSAIARSSWTRKAPVKSKVNPMRGVSKITVHHEGWKAVWFSDRNTTAQRIDHIRRYHVDDRGWGDIGYHYILDRAGRIWEGRPIQYQGAHVSNNNEHNIGVLVLGNFEKQSPSSAQLKTLYRTTQGLASQYRVKRAMVLSHQEINPTTCPGKNLQRQMDDLRLHVG